MGCGMLAIHISQKINHQIFACSLNSFSIFFVAMIVKYQWVLSGTFALKIFLAID